MRSLSKFVLAIVVAAVASFGAQAQRPGGGRQQQPQPIALLVLTNKDLQAELKITDDQKKDLKELMTKAEELNKKRAEAMSGGQPDRTVLQELQKEAQALGDEAKKGAEKLTDAQKKRIKQIDIQRMGLAAFANEDVAKELKVTDDQKKELKTIAEDVQKQMRDLRMEIGGGGGGRLDPEKQAELIKKSKEMTDAATEKVMKLMTDEQKKAYKEMTGDAFDISKLQVRPARRDN